MRHRTARAAVRRVRLRRKPARRQGGAAVAGCREAGAQAGHGLQRRQEWPLELQRRVRAVPVEARAVPAVAPPVAVEAGDGRRERERCRVLLGPRIDTDVADGSTLNIFAGLNHGQCFQVARH